MLSLPYSIIKSEYFLPENVDFFLAFIPTTPVNIKTIYHDGGARSKRISTSEEYSAYVTGELLNEEVRELEVAAATQ